MATPLVRLVRGRAVLVVCLALVTWLLSCLFSPQPQQLAKPTRQRPRILVPDEFQVAVIKGKFPALQIRMDGVAGKHGITEVFTDEDKGDEGPRPPALRFDLFKRGQQGSGTLGFRPPGAGAGRPGTTNPYQGMYRAAQQHTTRVSKPRNKTALLPVNEAQGKTPTIGALPERIAIIAASFPYRQQIEEFKRALHLPTVGAVLTEYVRGEKNKSWPSFGFDGVEVERMTLNEDGSDGQWEPLDVVEAYKQFFILTNRSVEKDKADYKPILAASRGLVMPVPAQLPEDLKSGKHSAAREVPDLLDKLDNIKKTLEKVKQASTKDIVPPSNPLTDTSFNPFDTEASTGGGKPTPGVTPPMPPTGTDPDSKYGSFYGNTEWQKKIGDDTPLDHCLVRFVDVHLEPGKFYKYRFKVRMMNPNYAPDPKARKDTYPQFAQDRVLTSDWSTVPQVVTVPPDQQVYALNLPDNWKLVNAELKKQEPWRWTFRPGGSPPRQEPSQAAVQIHRWVDYYRPNPDEPRLQAVGEWLVAARILVERGEYVHDPAYKVPVPIKPTDLF
ncbi:MAG TPA: hypothetical protein VKD72_22715, partial [Gemmataceae bacterium]|nr:hypothetical protein [Gemmataceae bacterium]